MSDGKRGRGRPPGSKNKSPFVNVTVGALKAQFQDDYQVPVSREVAALVNNAPTTEPTTVAAVTATTDEDQDETPAPAPEPEDGPGISVVRHPKPTLVTEAEQRLSQIKEVSSVA